MRVLLVLVLLTGTAYAQAPESVEPELKSTNVAAALSVAGTALPFIAILAIPDDPTTNVDDAFGLTAAALLVLAPSAGHWYAGEGVTTGLALRLTGAAIFTGLVLGDPDDRSRASPQLFAGATLAFGLVGVGAIWDCATARSAVVRHNARQYQLQVAPMAMSHGGTGLSLAGSF